MPASVGLIELVVVACGIMPAVAKVETWRQEGPAAFAKCRREGVVISDSGRVRLGHALSSLGSLAAERVWDLAQTPDGVLYAATGDAGKVFRREAKADAPWTVAYDSKDTQVLSLAVLPDGTVYAGTGPHGQIVNLSDPKHPASSSRPESSIHLGPRGRRPRKLVRGHRPGRAALEAAGRRRVVALLRQQGDSPALPGDRPGRSGLCRRRWRGLDLPGVARRQGNDPL